MTRQEEEILAALRDVWNLIVRLPVEHPLDASEACRDIHNLQNRILARATLRGHSLARRA